MYSLLRQRIAAASRTSSCQFHDANTTYLMQVGAAARAIANSATLSGLTTAEEVYNSMKTDGGFSGVGVERFLKLRDSAATQPASSRYLQNVLEALYNAALEFNTPLSENPAAQSDDDDGAEENAADSDEDE